MVDPGGEVEQIVDKIDFDNTEVTSVLLTHAHIDHAGGVMDMLAELEKKTGKLVPLFAHKAEAEMRKSIAMQAQMFGVPPGVYKDVREPDVYIDEGDEFSVGEHKGLVLFTPGHAPGHVSVYFEQGSESAPVLIAGDTLFQGSIGRTDLPGGDHQTLINSIKGKILTLPENTVVMSGHGPDTTVGAEARSNPFLKMD